MAGSVRKRQARRRKKDPKDVAVEQIIPLPFPTGAKWDADLTKDEVQRLNPEDKASWVTEPLRRKVARLQHLACNPALLATEGQLPQDRKRLREWKDPSRGLWSWTDVKLDNENHPRNGKLIVAFWKAVDDIAAARVKMESAPLKGSDDRDQIIDRLEKRMAVLLVEVQTLRKQVFGI